MQETVAVAVIAFVLAAPPAPARTTAEVAPREVVTETMRQVLEVLREGSLSRVERRDRLEQIARTRFDVDTTSRLVLGRSWRRFSPVQREEFRREFERYLLRSYGDRIDRYNQENVKVEGERREPRGDVTVRTRIVGGEFDGASVDYRMRQRDGKWRVIDVVVEGISLVANYRDQFKQVLARGGPANLLQKLHEKNDGTATEENAAEETAPKVSPAP